MLKKISVGLVFLAFLTFLFSPLNLHAQETLYAELTIQNLTYSYSDSNNHDTRAVPQDKIKFNVILENKSQSEIKDLNIELFQTEGVNLKEKKAVSPLLKAGEKQTLSFEGTLEQKENLAKITPHAEINSTSIKNFSTNKVILTVNTPQIDLKTQGTQKENDLDYEITFKNIGATSAFDPQLKLTLEGPANFISTSQAAVTIQPKNLTINLKKHLSEEATTFSVKMNLTSQEKVTLKLETVFKDINGANYSTQKTEVFTPQFTTPVKSESQTPEQSSQPTPQSPTPTETEQPATDQNIQEEPDFIPPDEGIKDNLPEEQIQTSPEEQKTSSQNSSSDKSTQIITILIIVFAVILAILIGALIYINYYEKKRLEL
jgi:ABC-type antimicrobial peptide transport system permease subunit